MTMIWEIANDANFFQRLVRHGDDDDVQETEQLNSRSLCCFDGISQISQRSSTGKWNMLLLPFDHFVFLLADWELGPWHGSSSKEPTLPHSPAQRSSTNFHTGKWLCFVAKAPFFHLICFICKATMARLLCRDGYSFPPSCTRISFIWEAEKRRKEKSTSLSYVVVVVALDYGDTHLTTTTKDLLFFWFTKLPSYNFSTFRRMTNALSAFPPLYSKPPPQTFS